MIEQAGTNVAERDACRIAESRRRGDQMNA